MNTRSIIILAIVALVYATETQASKVGFDPLLIPRLTAIDCVPRAMRAKYDRAAVVEMTATSRTVFFRGSKSVLRCKDWDSSRPCFSSDLVDFGEVIKSAQSLNLVSLSHPLSPASFALMDVLSSKMQPDDKSQQSLDNILVLLVPEVIFESQKYHLWAFGDGLRLPNNMMIAGIKPEEAYWLRCPADEEGIISIYEKRLPNQLVIYKNGILGFSGDFSMSTLDAPGTDIFVEMLIERLRKRVLRERNAQETDSMISFTSFPTITKSQNRPTCWDFMWFYRRGYVKATTDRYNKPIWSIHSEDGQGNSFVEGHPRITSAQLAVEAKVVGTKQ